MGREEARDGRHVAVAVVAMAQTVVMLTRGIDLTVGAMVSLGSVLSATLVADDFAGGAVGIAAVLAIGTVIGALIGAAVAVLRLPAIIVTLACSFIIAGMALLVMSRPGGSIPASISEALAGDHPTALALLIALIIVWRLFAATWKWPCCMTGAGSRSWRPATTRPAPSGAACV